MARVVQRRSNPPYLLIIFVFLFLVSTALFVMKFIGEDKALKERDNLLTQQSRLSGPQDQPLIQQLEKDTSQTVVSQLNSQVKTLANDIAPGQDTFSAAHSGVENLYEKLGTGKERLGLVALVDAKNKDIQDLQEQRKKLEGDIATLNNNIKNMEAQKKQAGDEYAAGLEKQKQLILKANEDFDAKLKKYADEAAKEADEHKTKTADYEKTISDKQTLITKLQGDVTKLKVDNSDLHRKIDDLTRPPEKGPVAAGKVISVKDQDRIAYINMGSKDRTPIGLTLSVFSPDNPEKPKAKLKVTSVGENSSECLIIEEDPKAPLLVGDPVSNMAFNTSRTYTFVVEGAFDLNGTGTPSLTGANQVIDLIKKSGGTVSDTVDRRTDYVVLGLPPEKPAKPKEGNAQDEKVYKEQMKAFDHYREIEAQAKALGIQILNSNRFIALIGYSSNEGK